MSDYIRKTDAINTSLEFFVEFLGGAFHENAQKELIARFQQMPSAQPEIVRCKDCRYKMRKGVDYFCDHITGEEIMVLPNDFCSWAERGTDG